jgi:hypothetical protein
MTIDSLVQPQSPVTVLAAAKPVAVPACAP